MLMEVETVAEWESKHTKEGPPVVDRNRNELFASGAIRSQHGTAAPPEDQGTLLRLKRNYWYISLLNETEQFFKFKAAEITTASNAAYFAGGGSVPCPGANSVEQLKAGKARIVKLLARVHALDIEIYQLPEEVAKRRQAEIIRERQQKAERVRAELQAVTLDDVAGLREVVGSEVSG